MVSESIHTQGERFRRLMRINHPSPEWDPHDGLRWSWRWAVTGDPERTIGVGLSFRGRTYILNWGKP